MNSLRTQKRISRKMIVRRKNRKTILGRARKLVELRMNKNVQIINTRFHPPSLGSKSFGVYTIDYRIIEE